MGSLMRFRFVVLAILSLNGCAAAAAVSAIPGVFVDRAVGFFSGQEVSLALDMQRSLAAVQQGLERMSLHVNVLEPVGDGYRIEFGNGELDGDVYLQRETARLTTMTVSAHRGLKHQASVESAIVKEVRSVSAESDEHARFSFDGYKRVYEKMDEASPELGWFLPGQKLHVSDSNRDGWLKLKLPSGSEAFIKGNLQGGGA